MNQHSRRAFLPHLPGPLLTAYLDINPANPRNQRTPRGYVTWLKATGRALENYVPRSDREAFRTQLQRVDQYLRMDPPRGRGVVVFSGSNVWEVVPLQVDVAEEVHWGKPSLQHMLWLLDEHRSRGVVVIEGSGARFFQFWLGSITEDRTAAFSADISSWRAKHLVGPSHPGVSKRHGVQRDRVRDRMAAHRNRFARELARRISRWAEEREIGPIVLAGINEMVDTAFKALPESMRQRVSVVRKALPRVGVGEVEAKLGPALTRWERQYEKALVSKLIEAHGSREVAIGLDATIARLQDGSVREMVAARGLSGSVRQCPMCGRADRSADMLCAACGAERQTRSLRTILPQFATLYSVPVEVVAGEAAAKLSQAGGIGAWLRTRKL
jgi:hypothetical protein